MIVADGVNKGRWPGQVLPPGWSPIGGEGQDGVTRFFVYYAEGFYFYRPEQLWRFQGNRNYWVSFTVEPNLKWGEYRHVSYGTNTEQMDLVRELHVPAMPGCYLDFGSAPGLIPPTEWEELWSEANETALEPAVSLEVALYPGAGHRLAVDTVISADPPQRPPSETKEKEGKYFGKRGIFAIYRIAENGGDFMQIAAAFHQAARARMMKEHHTKVPPWSQQSWAERIRMIEWGLTNGVDWSDFGTKVAKWALYEKIGAILYPSIGQFGPGDRMSGDFRTFNLHQQSGLLANI